MQNKRIDWIDVAKGYGIILVILGHCFNKETMIHNWIFSFHMPLFFLLSGYCFRIEKYKSLKEVIIDKYKSLIIPYIKFWVLGLAVTFLIPVWREEINLEGVLIDIYSGYPSSLHLTSTWYLVALFMCECIFWAVVKVSEYLKKKWIIYIFLSLSAMGGYLISVVKSLVYDSNVASDGGSTVSTFLPGNRLPLTLDTCMTALIFFAIGFWIKNNGAKYIESAYKKIILVVTLVVNVIIALGLNSRVNLHGCTLGNGLYFYIAAIAGSIAVIYFSKILCDSEVSLIKKLVTLFKFYGKNSLLVLGMQSLGIHLFILLINIVTNNNYVLYEDLPWKWGCFAFVFITFIMMPVSYRINDKLPKKIKI